MVAAGDSNAPLRSPFPDHPDPAPVIPTCDRIGANAETRRIVWPIILGYADSSRMLIAWCELRGSFRHFRTDRIIEVEMQESRFDESPASLRRRWEVWRAAQTERALPME